MKSDDVLHSSMWRTEKSDFRRVVYKKIRRQNWCDSHCPAVSQHQINPSVLCCFALLSQYSLAREIPVSFCQWERMVWNWKARRRGRRTPFLFTALVSFFPAAEHSSNTSDAHPPVGYAPSGTEDEQKHANSTDHRSHAMPPSKLWMPAKW